MDQTETNSIETGAVVRSIYAERKIPVYAISETEIDIIGNFTVLSSILIASATSLISFAVGILTNAAFAEKMTPAGEMSTRILAPGLIFIALICSAFAIWAAVRKNSLWKKIKGQTDKASL